MSSMEKKFIIPAKVYADDPEIRTLLFEGQIGLELETQRIDRNGHLAQTPHPFDEDAYIDRDFGEAQIEINTPPVSGADVAGAFLHEQLQTAHRKLAERGELLWPFSGPPAIGDDSEIRIAEYTGELEKKTIYRRYLASKYGRRKMALCGIHFNYYFSEGARYLPDTPLSATARKATGICLIPFYPMMILTPMRSRSENTGKKDCCAMKASCIIP